MKILTQWSQNVFLVYRWFRMITKKKKQKKKQKKKKKKKKKKKIVKYKNATLHIHKLLSFDFNTRLHAFS